MDKTKKCEICGEVKPLSQFSKSYRSRCKCCVAKAARQRRAENKAFWDEVAQMQQEQRAGAAQRYELTKIALQGLMAHVEIEGMNTRDIAETAVDIADETLRILSTPKVETQTK